MRAALVSQDFFPTLGIHPVRGRTFMAAEHKAGAPAVAVIGTDLWQHEFGGAPRAIGQSITLGRTAYTMVGLWASSSFDSVRRGPPTYGFPWSVTRLGASAACTFSG